MAAVRQARRPMVSISAQPGMHALAAHSIPIGDQLIAGCSTRLGEALAAMSPLALGAITEPTRQREVFEQAVTAFAARLGRPHPSESRPPAFRPDAVILVVHATALVSVLDDHPPDGTDQADDAAAVIGRLLLHEARYWQQSQTQYGLSLGSAAGPARARARSQSRSAGGLGVRCWGVLRPGRLAYQHCE